MDTKEINVTTKLSGGYLKIYINDIIHVVIKTSSFLSLQSWKENDSGWYKIKIYLTAQSVTLEYDSREKWEKVLSQFDKVTRA